MPKIKFRLSTVFLLVSVCAALVLAWLNHRRAERLAGELAAAEERLATAEEQLSALQNLLPLYNTVQQRLDNLFITGSYTIESEQGSQEPSGSPAPQ